MSAQTQIAEYLASLAEPARVDMLALHHRIVGLAPASRLWFLDGKDSKGKVVSNPNIGYGLQNMEYANGKTREFYRVGISANTGGVSIYIMGLTDKTYLTRTYAKSIGKAKVTGYCINFKRLSDLNLEVLEAAIRDGLKTPSA
jgi:hypothetical protein